MKTKKLFLIIALVVGCAVGAHAQKTVFKFRDAQARAGDAVTEVCVKPTVVEVKILEDKGRIPASLSTGILPPRTIMNGYVCRSYHPRMEKAR